jgi:hypothetical protein
MRTLILASAALALVFAAPASATPKKADAGATAPAEKTRAAPHYDCSKKNNANKAQCKDAAAAPAATPAAAAKPAAAAAAAAKAAPAAGDAPAKTKGTGNSKMKDCAAQWHKLSDAQKADWKAKGAAMKSKKSGKPLNEYLAFSSDCMKK